MKRVKASTWEELDALPEGEWVEVVGGLDVVSVEGRGRGRTSHYTMALDPEIARHLRPRSGEILEARLRGRKLELTRRKRKPASRT